MTKLTPLQRAKFILQDRLKITDNGCLLKQNGKFVPMNVDDIIRSANKLLLNDGIAQIDNNPAWVVK